MKINIPCILISISALVLCDSKLYAQTNTAPTISISGATVSPTNAYYYIVPVPTNNTTNVVTITAVGGVPALPTNDLCTNCTNSYAPSVSNSPQYTFVKGLGTQSASNGPVITVNVTSNTPHTTYNYQVTQQRRPIFGGLTGCKILVCIK